jgi:ABC-type glycerol-3-phosphate transport system substrate-binding protein
MLIYNLEKNMKYVKKRYFIILTAVFALVFTYLFFVKESKKISYYEFEPTKTEIRLVSDWNSIDSVGDCFQGLVKKFNDENDDVQITNAVQSSEEYWLMLKLDFASDNEPDVFLAYPNKTINKYAEMDKITALNKYLEEDENWYNSFDKSIWGAVSYNGKIYALPIENTYAAMYVNKDILNKCGLNIPTTYEQLKGCIPKLKQNGYIPIAFDISDSGALLFEAIIARLGGKFYSGNIKNNGEYNPRYIINRHKLCRQGCGERKKQVYGKPTGS